MTTKNVLALALDALEISLACIKHSVEYKGGNPAYEQAECANTEAITAIKQAQQAQEPVTRLAKAQADLEQSMKDGINVHGAMAALVAAQTEQAQEPRVNIDFWVPVHHEQLSVKYNTSQFSNLKNQVHGFGKIVGTHGKVVEWPVLPQQAQEPVAHVNNKDGHITISTRWTGAQAIMLLPDGAPLYATPPEAE